MTVETSPTEAWRAPSDADIRAILAQRIDVERAGVGIVVGVIDAAGQRIVAHGALAEGDRRPLDGDTVFEIGSITKAFTGLLLADMALRGEVALDDPVIKHLPPGVAMPERGGRQITLIDLATHTSGLPRWPDDLSREDWTNPYADYTVEQLYAFLGAYKLRRDIGAGFLYSNLGMGLLGHALARRAGVSYLELIRERITGPLGMVSTDITLSPAPRARFATGHDPERRPVSAWDMPTFAGAGALRSTANDLLALLAAELGYVGAPLLAAMAAQLEPRRPSDADYAQALGWRVSGDAGEEIVWHGGATGGFRCFVLFDRQRGAGVVVLTNTASVRNDDVGFHLLSGRPLAPPPERAAVRLDIAALDRLVGRYELSAARFLLVTRQETRLFAQLTAQPAFEVFPQSPTDIFWTIADARARFEIDAAGGVTGLVLSQNGRDIPATRVPRAGDPA